MPTPTRKQRIKDMRAYAGRLRRFLSCICGWGDGVYRLDDTIRSIEKGHRNMAPAGIRYLESKPCACDYFLIQSIFQAMELGGPDGTALVSFKRFAGYRRDILQGISLVAMYGDDLRKAGFTATSLRDAHELTDYYKDIAGRA